MCCFSCFTFASAGAAEKPRKSFVTFAQGAQRSQCRSRRGALRQTKTRRGWGAPINLGPYVMLLQLYGL